MALIDKLTAIADAIREKTGKTEELTLAQMATEIAGIEAGGGGIGAVKFLDVDITVEASTTTAVTYTVDGLEFVSSVENPDKWNSFAITDTYIAFVTPKKLTGTISGNFARVYNSSMWIGRGNTNYTPTVINTLYDGLSIQNQTYGIYGLGMNCTSVEDGKIIGNLTATVRHHQTSGYEVVAGTYNIQMYYMDWKWGN